MIKTLVPIPTPTISTAAMAETTSPQQPSPQPQAAAAGEWISPHPQGRKRRRQTKRKEVSECACYGVWIPSETAELDAGLVLTGLAAFKKDYEIEHHCIAWRDEGVRLFIRFAKSVNNDFVLGLMTTLFPTGTRTIVPLPTKTLKKNFLTELYTYNNRPFQNLPIEDKLVIPFELVLPSWLDYYKHNIIDLEDKFLIHHAHLYPYISARLMNNYADAVEQ